MSGWTGPCAADSLDRARGSTRRAFNLGGLRLRTAGLIDAHAVSDGCLKSIDIDV
jgi:hypothetical protein